MQNGASIESILFFRYAIAVTLLGAFLLLRRHSFRITWKQAGVLLVLGLLYTTSSLTLFEAYRYIASGLATTIVFLYPVLVAIIMVFLRVVPSWPVWLSIALTFAGVVIMTQGDSSQAVRPMGLLLSFTSALVYALFIVIINRSKVIGNISNSLLTFYALSVGTLVFWGKIALSGAGIMTGLTGHLAWLNLVGLGDVGGALLTGLKLLGHDVEQIGIFDPDEARMARYEMELNQVLPIDGRPLPKITCIGQDQLFACDALLFTASKGVPPLGQGPADGLGPVGLDVDLAPRAAHAGQDVLQNRPGVLGAGVVGGDHRHAGCGHPKHRGDEGVGARRV